MSDWSTELAELRTALEGFDRGEVCHLQLADVVESTGSRLRALLAPQTQEEITAALVHALSKRPMRNRELLSAARIDDYRRGEDQIWGLVSEGRIRIGPDSLLHLVSKNVVRVDFGRAPRRSRPPADYTPGDPEYNSVDDFADCAEHEIVGFVGDR